MSESVLAAAGDTWGIPGSAFLVGYVVALVGVVVAVSLRSRRLADVPVRDPRAARADLDRRPHDVAYLNGGPGLAVLSALSSLRVLGAVTATKGTVTTIGRVPYGASDLEYAVAQAALRPVRRSRLPLDTGVRSTLDTMHRRLLGAGMLLPPERRSAIRRLGLWFLGLAAVGIVRIVAGVGNDRPVGFLVMLVLFTVGLGVLQLCRSPRQRSVAGTAVLAELRQELDHFAPRSRPSWAVYGPAGAAMGIGLFGAATLVAADPAMASDLAARQASGSSWSGGGDSGGAWGGDSGGGGGSDGGGGGGGCGGGGGGGGCGG